MIELKPISPERLAEIQAIAEHPSPRQLVETALVRELVDDRERQVRRADAAERERDELLRAAANIGTEMPGLEDDFAAMGSAGAVTRSAASMMVAAVRLHHKVETGIVCTVDVDGRAMEVIAQWQDAPVRTNWVAMAADMLEVQADAKLLRDRLQALSKRWHEEAQRLWHGDGLNVSPSEGDHDDGKANGIDDCADEVDDLLAEVFGG